MSTAAAVGLVVDLDGSGHSVDLVGGKAAAVDRLVGLGFPVPPSVAVTAEASRRFLVECGLEADLERLESRPPPDPADMEAEAHAIDETFLRAPIPGELHRALTDIVDRLGGRVAVRSSATVEDAEAASYAGQFRSLLDVDAAGIDDAVKLVWASLWHPSPRAYRRASGEAGGNVAMGVLIMAMVPARHAGVTFTVDPEGGGAVRVEVVQGSGEALVSGEVTPEVHRVQRHDLAGVGGRLASVVTEAAHLALRAEHHFGAPQDVEWVHDAHRVHVLQARPITVTPPLADDDDGFDTPIPDGTTYTAAGIAEALPGHLPPLLWTLDGHLLEEAFRRMFDSLGVLPEGLARPNAIVGRVRGRACLNLDLLRSIARRMPGGSAAELERQYFGEVVSETDELDSEERPSLPSRLVAVARTLRLQRRLEHEAMVVVEAIDRLVHHDLPLDSAEPERLVAYHLGIVDLAARAIAVEAAVAATAAATYQALEDFLRRVVGDEAPGLAQRVTTGRVQTFEVTPIELQDLVEEAASDRELAEMVRASTGPDDLFARFEEHPSGRAFMRRCREALKRSGSVTVFAGHTWREQPDVARTAVVQAMRAAVDRSNSRRAGPDPLSELDERLRSRRWRAIRVLTGQVVDIRSRLLRRLVTDTARFLSLRERTKAAVLLLGGEARRGITRMAELLVADGILSSIDDVDLLSHEELLAGMRGQGLPSPEALDERRKRGDAAREAGPLPRRFTGRPGGLDTTVTTGETIEGWGAGPGVHRGRPRVVDDIASAELDDGDVLVARTTDPSWTPLFLKAGAVVVEEGGPLSHAAIVARELGIPAVLNATGATAALASVDEVTVDGTAGRVTVEEP